jgi:hypothetical protein
MDGDVYGKIDDKDYSRVEQILIHDGASWVYGQTRCCDIPKTDTLDAFVTCRTVVAPHSPTSCTVTPAVTADSSDDAFMFKLLTDAGVAADTDHPAPGASTKYTAHVRVTKGGFAGMEIGDISWGDNSDASIEKSDLSKVEAILTSHGATWGDTGPVVHADMQTSLEVDVTCSESVSAHPIATCAYRADNIRPL